MADVIGLDGTKLIAGSKKPEPDTGTFQFSLNDEAKTTFQMDGFLVVTSIFAAVGRGEGEIVAMVPMAMLKDVRRIA